MSIFLDPESVPTYFFASWRQFDAGERHITRYCDEDVLLVMTAGVLRFWEDGVPVELVPGEYYIQKRGLYQQGIEKSDCPCYFFIHFQGEWNEQQGIPCRGTYPPVLLPKIDALAHLLKRDTTRLALSAAFLDIMATLNTFQHAQTLHPIAVAAAKCLRAHWKEGISLRELSETLNYSPNYIIRVFKDAFGKTPHEYCNELRLREASELLKYTDLPLSVIAENSGFGCYVNFYKAYRQAYGKSPRRR